MNDLTTMIGELTDEHPDWVEVLAGRLDRTVAQVHLIDSVERLDHVEPDALVVLERGLADIVDDYRFDIALRRAAHRSVGAVMVIRTPGAPISLTAAALARRADITVLGLTPEADITTAMRTLVRQSLSDLALTMDRVRRVYEAVVSSDAQDATDLLSIASEHLGRPITVIDDPPSDADMTIALVPLDVTGRQGSHLRADRFLDPDADALLEILLWRIATEITHAEWESAQDESASRRAVSEMILQLACADPGERARLSPSAIALGIPVQSWHTIARIEFEQLGDPGNPGASTSVVRESLSQMMRESLRNFADAGTCHIGHDQAKMLVAWSTSSPPTTAQNDSFHRHLDGALSRMAGSVTHLTLMCGTGRTHAGAEGFLTSASEARQAASSARLRQRPNRSVRADTVGMRSTLLEWYGSPTVRHAVDQLLAPLDELTTDRQLTTLQTLATYLDFQGNTAKTAEALHLHRNAVRYRIQRALYLLAVDEQEPDQRLFLHLACRARLESDPTVS